MQIGPVLSSHAVIAGSRPFLLSVRHCAKAPHAFLLNETTGRRFDGKVQKQEEGSYRIRFAPQEPSFDVFHLELYCEEETLCLEDLRFGEVFLLAGQSNLSLPLSLVEKRENYRTLANDSDVSVLNIEDSLLQDNGEIFRPEKPWTDLSPKIAWQRLSSSNAFSFSAIGVMFALQLAKKRRVPVGLVLTAVGGISIDSYLSREMVESDAKCKDYLIQTKKYLAPGAPYNVYGGGNYTQMAGLFNEKIAPLKDLSFQAVIWYQGENSCYDFASALYFRSALETLIKGYRAYFHDASLPFFLMGLADEYYPYGDGHGLLYIQEQLSLVSLERTFYIPIYDIFPRWQNDDDTLVYHPIHTIVKEKVAGRILQSYLACLIHQQIFFYPFVKAAEPRGNGLCLEVKTALSSFKVGAHYLGFTLAGEERKYHAASAVAIDGNHLLLSAKEVRKPLFYTYAFVHDAHDCDCHLKNGMPLIPSRSISEDYSASVYLANQAALSCSHLEIEENNFGFEVGLGRKTALWKKGSLYPNENTSISLDKKDRLDCQNTLKIKGEGTHDSYFYFSLEGLLAPSGMEQNLSHYAYLSLALRSDKPVEWHGALWRDNGKIYKLLPSDGKTTRSFFVLGNSWKRYAISLTVIADGSEAIYPMPSTLLAHLSVLEFYFRGKGRFLVHLGELRPCDEFCFEGQSESQGSDTDSAIRLPPAQQGENHE